MLPTGKIFHICECTIIHGTFYLSKQKYRNLPVNFSFICPRQLFLILLLLEHTFSQRIHPNLRAAVLPGLIYSALSFSSLFDISLNPGSIQSSSIQAHTLDLDHHSHTNTGASLQRNSSGKFTCQKKSNQDQINAIAQLKLLHENELTSLRADHDVKMTLLQATHDENLRNLQLEWDEDLDYFNRRLNEQEDELASKYNNIQELSEQIESLKANAIVAASKSSIEIIFELLSVNLQREIKRIPSWNKLGTRKKGDTTGQTRDKQKTVSFHRYS